MGRFTQADTIVPQPSNPQSLNRYSYTDGNPINYPDPTGHGWWKRLWEKIDRALDKFAKWCDEHNIDIGWVGFEYSTSYGPGGGNGSPAPQTSPYEDMGQPYSENYGYEYDPFYDPIVSPAPEPTAAQAPIPERHLLDVTTEELGNLHVLSQIDPIAAKIQSGDFTQALDSVSTITEKIFVLNQIPGNTQRPQAAKKSTREKIASGFETAGSAYSASGLPGHSIAATAVALTVSEAGPFEKAGRVLGGILGGLGGGAAGGFAGSFVAGIGSGPYAFWGAIFGAKFLSEKGAIYGRKLDIYIANRKR